MKVELVGFYPEYSNNNVVCGTVHAYLTDFKMDIRGILYIKREKSSYVFVQSRFGWDEDENCFIQYPTVSFTSDDDQVSFLNSIRILMGKHLKTWKRPKDLPATKRQAAALRKKRQEMKKEVEGE